MIKSLKIIKELHPFLPCEFKFKQGLNIIVGDNGSGKSTLLEAIMLSDQEFANHVIIEQDHKHFEFAYFDSEKHNPRQYNGGLSIGETRYSATLDMFFNVLMERLRTTRLSNSHHFQTMLVNAYGTIKNASSNIIDKKLMDLDVISRSAMQSHGEVIIPFLDEALKIKNGIIFLDEPETSLSLKSLRKLAAKLISASKENQIFMTTHSEILMNCCNKLLSMDDKMWVDTGHYIKNQTTVPAGKG